MVRSIVAGITYYSSKLVTEIVKICLDCVIGGCCLKLLVLVKSW